MKFILFLFSVIFLTNAQVPSCPTGSLQLDLPQNASIITYYPKEYGYNYTLPLFPDNFNCNYKINVPQGWFAKIYIRSIATNPSNKSATVVVTNQLGEPEELYQPIYAELFYFLANGGSIFLSTGLTNSSFGFTIGWQKLPTTFTPYLINVNRSDIEPQSARLDSSATVLVTAETRVSVLVVPPEFSYYTEMLRGIMIYDGPYLNSTCFGSGWQLWKSNRQWVSTGKQVTVQLLDDYTQTMDDTARIIFQEYENTKRIVQYQGVACGQMSLPCQATLDNSQGPSAIVTYEANDSYFNIVTSLIGNGTLDVYIGGITPNKENLIASYQVDNSVMFLPQTFRGYTRTYVLNGNNSKAIINFETVSKNLIQAQFGKKGFISSSHYPQTVENHNNQYAMARINAPDDTLATYSFVIRYADITENSSLYVNVTNQGQSAYKQWFNITNLPPFNQTITAIGNVFSVEFSSNGDTSKGLYMDYEVLKGSSKLFFVLAPILITSFIVLIF